MRSAWNVRALLFLTASVCSSGVVPFGKWTVFSGEVLGYKSAVEAIEAMQIVQLFGRGFHEPDIGREVVKEGARERSAQHRDVGVRVLGGERIDYRHGHRHVAHR